MEQRRDHARIFYRFKPFLAYLGHPERGFQAVHVGGTSGKGTVTNLIHHILRAGGKRVGSLYSPHVTTSLERIFINDCYIRPGDFARLLESVKPALTRFAERGRWQVPSYFEIFTVLALLALKEAHVEYAVLEVGAGGAYDATNVIPAPRAAIITNVGLDHQKILGKTRSAIARTKSEIIKRGTGLALTAEPETRTANILKARAAKLRVPFENVFDPKDMSYTSANENLARRTGAFLGIAEKDAALGLKKARLPGRFEIIQQRPRVILDTAHNTEKITALMERLRTARRGKLHVVFACAANKNGVQMIRTIARQTARISITRFNTSHRMCYDMAALQKALPPNARRGAQIDIDPLRAFARALEQAKHSDTILVTGSTFLVGDIRKRYVSEEDILERRSSFTR